MVLLFFFFFYSKAVSLPSLTLYIYNCHFKLCMPCWSCHKVYTHESMKFYYASKMLILLCKFSVEHFIVGNVYMRRTWAGAFHQCVRRALWFSILFLPQCSFIWLSQKHHKIHILALLSTFYKRKNQDTERLNDFTKVTNEIASHSFFLLVLCTSFDSLIVLFYFCHYKSAFRFSNWHSHIYVK